VIASLANSPTEGKVSVEDNSHSLMLSIGSTEDRLGQKMGPEDRLEVMLYE